MITALKFENFSIQYQLFKVLTSAKLAVSVLALGEIKEFIFWVLFVADQTSLICFWNWWLSFASLLIIVRYLDASFPNELLLLQKIDLIDLVLNFKVRTIVFKSNYASSLVILMSKM